MAKKKKFKGLNETKVLYMVFITLAILVIGTFIIANPRFTGFVALDGCDGDWVCDEWSACVDDAQTRTCTSEDATTCDSPKIESQVCTITCVEDWICDDWTDCVDDTQTRTCTDDNTCGTTEDKPEESQVCTIICDGDWVCDEWSACVDDAQTRTCTSEDATTCDSPKIESQVCTITCVEDWICDDWTDCVDDTQTRTCTDDNTCGTTEDKPEESQVCTIVNDVDVITGDDVIRERAENQICMPNWECGAWSECVEGTQGRECSDTSYCGVEESKPAISQSCEAPETCSDEIRNQDERGVDCGGVCEERCGFFTIMGNAINVPVNSSAQFVKDNKALSFSFLGVVVLVVSWLLVAKFVLKKGAFFFLKDFHMPKDFTFFKRKKKLGSGSNQNS